MSPDDRDTRDKALEDQKAGKNLKEASQNIIYLTDKDNYTDKLLYQYGQGTLDKAGEAALTEYLNAYATQLQLRGMSESDALKAVEQILKYPSSAAPDLSAEYNKALGQLSTEERHAWQAMIGTDALLAGPGRVSQLMRLALISGGSYQAGTGIGQIIDGKVAEGSINVGLGGLAVSGGYLGNKVTTGKPNVIPPKSVESGHTLPTEPVSSEWKNSITQSRVNVRIGDSSTGSGLDYAWKKHGGEWGANKSHFTVTKDELKVILQSDTVVKSPVIYSQTTGNYMRFVDMGRPIGIDAKSGGNPTSTMTVITDKHGNLVNTFPGKTKVN